MKNSIFLFFFIFSYEYSSAQSLHVDWTRFIGDDSCCAEITYAIATQDGGVAFVGIGDPGSGDLPASPYTGVMVGKMDSNRDISWAHTYGAATPVSMCQTFDGGYAILSYTEGASGYITGIKGSGDMWLMRIDSVGNFLWGNCYGSIAGNEQAFSIATTKDHGLILLGASNGAGEDVPFHLGSSEFEYDWFVVKTDSLGNKQWTRDLGGSGDELGDGGSILAVDTGYYLVGASNSTDYDCTDSSWHHGVNTGYDYYVLRLNDSGNVMWAKSYGGSNTDMPYNAVWDYRDNTVLITGGVNSNDYMVDTLYGGTMMWTVKTDNNGNLLWARSLDAINSLYGGTSIALASGGYVNLGGTNPADFTSDGDDPIMFVLDNMGNVSGNAVFGSMYHESAASVFAYKQGYIATGQTASPVGFSEGYNFGRINPGGHGFVSYLSCCPSAVPTVVSADKELQLYPNPADGIVNIIPPATGRIIVYNIMGETLFAGADSKQIQTIETSAWPEGLFVVRWLGADGTVATAKFINK